jgi:UDP-N-acetylglucosamine 4-epimerase
VNGFVNVAFAAKEAGVRRLVFASSSSVYGDHPDLPKVEGSIGNQLSPYAVTKYVNELYASVFGRCYGLQAIGLRYFNVFGARQDPQGPYAAVIPRWVKAMLHHEPVTIFGDGETSRDFCYVLNAVEANVRAALTANAGAPGQVFNVAFGARTNLRDLFDTIRYKLELRGAPVSSRCPEYAPFRDGDVRHSLADTSKARNLIDYQGVYDLSDGLDASLAWYMKEYGMKAS